MKQILVISGKGGTGKTVVTSSLAALAKKKVMVDCDVDAADLHILLNPTIQERTIFKSGYSAKLDPDICIQCGKCINACRFSAIHRSNDTANANMGETISIDPVGCEGCGLCALVCPVKAISMEENISGEWYVSETRFGPMVHARLGIAEENSGKLVSQVRQKATEIAEEKECDWVIIDGSPGIGCPVIASLSGIDLAVVVTEPTVSGLHDADRVIQVAKHFHVPTVMVLNKCDLNNDVAQKIVEYCESNAIQIIGKIPFDETVVKALIEKKTIVEYGESDTKKTIEEIWQAIQKVVLKEVCHEKGQQ